MFSMFKKSSDPYEEMLNGLKRRILRGETISMLDFLDTLDDLSEEPDETATDEEIQEAADAREWFLSELRRFGLPPESRYELCVSRWRLSQNKKRVIRLSVKASFTGSLKTLYKSGKIQGLESSAPLTVIRACPSLFNLPVQNAQLSPKGETLLSQPIMTENRRHILSSRRDIMTGQPKHFAASVGIF